MENINNMSDIYRLSDKYFPIRDSNNMPSYRPHQRETIALIVKAFYIDGKKFVALDGPVGCGKSAINYTVAMITQDAAYLTPLKMLQDQVAAEKWPHVRMLKGSSSYLCNVAGYATYDYKCNYDGDNLQTCNNGHGNATFNSSTLKNLSEEIKYVHDSFGNNEYVIMSRSSFNSHEDFEKNVDNMKYFVAEQRISRMQHCDIQPNEYMDFANEKHLLEENICCSVNPKYECPSKSSKLLAKMARMKVLNPDIFFLLSRIRDGFYSSNELLIYDECQQIEGVLNRIFKKDFPVKIVSQMFGIDTSKLVDIKNAKECIDEFDLIVKQKIGPLAIASYIINKLANIIYVKNDATLLSLISNSKFDLLFGACAQDYLIRFKKEDNINIIDILDCAFTGSDIPVKLQQFTSFIKEIRDEFKSQSEFLNCNDTINLNDFFIPTCKRIFKHNIETYRKKATKELNSKQRISNVDIKTTIPNDDYIYLTHLADFNKIVGDFVSSFCQLFDSESEKPDFMLGFGPNRNKYYMADKYSEDFKYNQHDEESISITPIAIGRIMNRFFYSRASKVLLTSGTWVCVDGLFKLYGVDKNNCEFIKIPSTFKPENRGIYVLDSKSFTNFSSKNSDEVYSYKTQAGTNKFTLEMNSIIKRVRSYIYEKHGENSNVIVHCHSFDIAKRIAEYCSGIDDSYLIHMPGYMGSVRNVKNGYITPTRDKNELISIIKDSPNKGLTIVSPSISEGVDFKGQIARAQIILKNPIPNLGDSYINAYYRGNKDLGIDRDPDFLNRACFTIMTQQYGRVVRSEDDWGYTIIMDQSITENLKKILKSKNKVADLNIRYFMDGLRLDKDKDFDWIFG